MWSHDCVIGDYNTIANSVQFAGHVEVGNRTLIGGISGIHQFVRIGDYAMLGFSNTPVARFATVCDGRRQPG